jgi:hypothetical protein
MKTTEKNLIISNIIRYDYHGGGGGGGVGGGVNGVMCAWVWRGADIVI